MKNSTTNKPKRRLNGVLVALLWIGAWQLLALLVNQQLFLASPITVFTTMIGLLQQKAFYAAVFNSLAHITAGFLLAFLLGLLLAAASSKWNFLKRILHPLMTVINSTPVASFIILALILVGSKHIATLTSFLMVVPVLYTNLLSGIESIGRQMFEAADVFDMPRSERLRYIYFPETLPYLLSGCSVAIGMSWKAGVAAEVIGLTAGSIGEKLYNAKIFLDTAELFAYTLVIIVVSLLFEKLFQLILSKSKKAILGS